jgi:uncharacterized protein (TIGR03435 family)
MYNGIGNKFTPGTSRWTNVPLKALIGEIYRMKDYQILGGPAWIDSDRWDIEGKAAGPATNSGMVPMMQTLLADRFQLKFHRETRQLPVYRLTVAKGGPKLTAAHPQDADHRWGTTPGPGSLMMKGATMQEFAYWLSVQLNQPVIESTALTGRYDLKLEWAEDDNAIAEAAKWPVFSAVEQQLGLRLEATKGPVEVLVIDHVEKASGN